MLVTLTFPLTHVKDEVKSVVAVTTSLMLIKIEVQYDRYTFTTLLNGVKGESKYAMNFFYLSNTYVETDKRKFKSCI